MRHQGIKKFSPLLLPLLCSAAYGNEFGGDLSAATFHSDNALKTANDEISERHDEYSLGLTGDYSNQLVTFTTEYRAREYRFAKESQPDRNTLEGSTSLLIGQEHHPADLLLSHSRRSLKSNTDAVDLLQDRDEREIFSAVPTLRYRATEVDSLMLRGDISRIDYRYTETRNSDRRGGSLIWLHRFSEVDSVNVSVHSIDITYDYHPESDYQYEQALVNYTARLSQLVYTVEAGYNASKPEVGEDLSEPSFRFDATYTAGANLFSLGIDQRITDTSMGNGNSGDIFDAGSVNDVGNVGFDQIDRRSLTLGYSNNNLCGRCTVSLNLRARDDNYKALNEDNRDQGADINFDYRLTQESSIGFQINYLAQKFEEGVVREDYDQTRARIYYRMTFARDFSVEITAGTEERNSDDPLQTYKEAQSGLSLSYRF